MGRLAIAALRTLLAVIMLGALVAQVWFFPTLAVELADSYPDLAWLHRPMLALVVLVILGAEVALVAVWRLLSMVEGDSVFSQQAFRWVDVITAAAIVDTVLVLTIWTVLTFGANANNRWPL